MTTGALDDHGPRADPLELLGSQVQEIMSTARKSAAHLQSEMQRSSTERSAEIETAAARRAHAVRMAAEAEAERLHAHALLATRQYVTASRRLVDEFAKERMCRIADVGDTLAEQAEALVARLTRADDVARQLDELRAALGAASERIAAEAGRDSPEMPQLAHPTSTAPTTTVDGAPAPAQDAGIDAAPSQDARLARATGRPAKRVAQAGEPTPTVLEEVADDA